jgi:GWxTD domain-containing protein
MRMRLFAFAVILSLAGIAEAGLSKQMQDWRRGPEKFLMTDEEEKAWKKLSSDAEATAFIDLFWARRDPTPGTKRNEFREEFANRVRYADAAFEEKRNRGALTDRGQVYIVLGPPESGTRGGMEIAQNSNLSSASARQAENVVWTYPRELAVSLNVPRIVVTFNQFVGTDVYNRDTKFGQFSNVSAAMIKKNIVDPAMTTVPDWAARTENATAIQPAPANAKLSGRIGRLVLVSDLGGLNPDAATDPMAALQPAKTFAINGDVAFVLEYCGVTAPMKIETKIGTMSAASEFEPAPMKAVAGCGVIPGIMPLAGLKAGTYTLEVTAIEPGGARSTVKQGFDIQ